MHVGITCLGKHVIIGQLNKVSKLAIPTNTVSRRVMAVAFTLRVEAGVSNSVQKVEAFASVLKPKAVVSAVKVETVCVSVLTMGSVNVGSSSPASTR